MHSNQWIRAFALTLVALAAFVVLPSAQVQTAAPAGSPVQNAGFCGGRPLCFDAGDFAAIITEFRTSETGGLKVVDELVHFQNKTNQPVILGYVDGSASAIDDRGNRFALNPYGGNGIRGMGVVSGNNIDPKFTLQPGGGADARFELIERLGPLQGVSYETELSIREINRIEGNQFVLGGETLMHYQGLANGMGVAAPASASGQTPFNSSSAQGLLNSASAQNPCGSMPGTTGTTNTANQLAGVTNSAAVQNTTANATNQLSSAANTFSNLGSLFGHKKTTAPTPTTGTTTTASVNPCPSMATPGAAPAYSAAPVMNAASPQMMNNTSTAVAAPASAVKAAVSPQPATGATRAVAQPVRATVPVKTAVQITPLQPAKPPAQPVKAVAKTPVAIPAAKKPVQ